MTKPVSDTQLISAIDAVRYYTGDSVSVWTVRRWCKHGLAPRTGKSRIRLWHRVVGTRYMTTIAAVAAFFDHTTVDRQRGVQPVRTREQLQAPDTRSIRSRDEQIADMRAALRVHYPDHPSLQEAAS